MEHVYGILFDEKFLYRSVHAVFVNTTWYEAWLERTLLFDPIIFDMWSPGVLSWAPGQPCNSHYSRHSGQDTVVVPYLRFGFFLHHKSVGGRGDAASSLMRFSPSPSCRGDAENPWLRVIFRVPPLLVFPCSSASGTARARSFYTHERSRTTESTVFEHIHHKDRRQLQLFQRLALRQGRASFCDICQHTSSRPPIHTMEQRRHGRWRSHGSTVAQPLWLY